ncbi:hypothetical protein DSL64_15825 [Dyadobacter luteus]|uniref:Uncharacterized protein n=1 Tax=Dyadobacter luteus TaxID=2259619 RepID=A0A3D8YCV7_9BACT|nr:hypothetical protein DSL64_15825 [Dyadobacter luteus]
MNKANQDKKRILTKPELLCLLDQTGVSLPLPTNYVLNGKSLLVMHLVLIIIVCDLFIKTH